MKKSFLIVAFLQLVFLTGKSQVINCGSFCVLDVTYDSVSPFNMNVTIYSHLGAGQVNYPSVLVVNNVGDTIANPNENFYFFAQLPGDTVVHSIPTTDSTLSGLPYTIYFQDNIYFNGCVFTFPMLCNVGVSSELVSNNNILNVFPNPATNIVNIQVSEINNLPSMLEIKNIVGEVVYQNSINEQQTSIDVSQLSKGIYFVFVKSGNRLLTGKLSIQ